MVIGVDLGGTRIKGILMEPNGHIIHQIVAPTNDGDGDAWKMAVLEVVHDLAQMANTRDLVVGISAPGLPNQDNTMISYMPGRLDGIENFLWSEFLSLESYVIADGQAAMVAESKLGAAIDSVNAIMVTLGTGVGGALLIGGRVYQGSFLKAGNIGHSVVDCNGPMDVTGMPGSLEQSMGNYNISERSHGRFSSTREMVDAYRQGNTFAKEVWLASVRKLALSLASASNLLSPDTIVIGGGIAEANEALFDPLNTYFDQYEWQPGGIRPRIVKAVHGDMAGALGAAFFAIEKSSHLTKSNVKA